MLSGNLLMSKTLLTFAQSITKNIKNMKSKYLNSLSLVVDNDGNEIPVNLEEYGLTVVEAIEGSYYLKKICEEWNVSPEHFAGLLDKVTSNPSDYLRFCLCEGEITGRIIGSATDGSDTERNIYIDKKNNDDKCNDIIESVCNMLIEEKCPGIWKLFNGDAPLIEYGLSGGVKEQTDILDQTIGSIVEKHRDMTLRDFIRMINDAKFYDALNIPDSEYRHIDRKLTLSTRQFGWIRITSERNPVFKLSASVKNMENRNWTEIARRKDIYPIGEETTAICKLTDSILMDEPVIIKLMDYLTTEK